MAKSRSDRFAYYSRGTYCTRSSNTFAEETAAAITAVVEKWQPTEMAVRGYTPPYEPEEFPQGYLELVFLREEGVERSIGIEFGQTDENGQFQRVAFETDEWLAEPENPLSSAITAINFDEAWRIVCLVGRYLRIRDVSFGYGY
jgi:hypothetical protein